jgi:hypothetical protein
MAKARQNFKLYRGTGRNVQIVLGPDTPNLTGANASFLLGTNPEATGDDVLIRKRTQDNNMAITYDPIGTKLYSIVVPLTGADTMLLPVGEIYMQAIVTEASGIPHLVSSGKVTVEGTMS